jgi:hypothetical protein
MIAAVIPASCAARAKELRSIVATKTHPAPSDAVLGETRSQYHDRHGAHYSSDHAEPASAQRSAEMRLTNESRGCSGPIRVVELEPKRKIERGADCNPQSQAE